MKYYPERIRKASASGTPVFTGQEMPRRNTSAVARTYNPALRRKYLKWRVLRNEIKTSKDEGLLTARGGQGYKMPYENCEVPVGVKQSGAVAVAGKL